MHVEYVELIKLSDKEFKAVLDVYNLLEELSVEVKGDLRGAINDGHEALKRILENAKEAELNDMGKTVDRE